MTVLAEIQFLPKNAWMKSRIPLRDALVAIIPTGVEPNIVIKEIQSRIGEARWYPEGNDLRAVFPYDGKDYDRSVFYIEPRGWNYNECHIDIKHFIPAMTLCYVTKPGYPYRLICSDCYEQYVASGLVIRIQCVIKALLRKLH